MTATASNGPVTTQVTVGTVVWRLRATLGRETTKTVKRMLLESRPARVTARTSQR